MLEQLHLGSEPMEELWNPIKNRNFVKPFGGLWTSTFLPDGTSDWIRWCINEEFLDPNKFEKWILTPSKNARIFNINDYSDVVDLCNGNPMYGCFVIPDFEELAKKYDGIHLTKKGQALTRFSLYGWDCESTLWLNWAFSNVRKLK